MAINIDGTNGITSPDLEANFTVTGNNDSGVVIRNNNTGGWGGSVNFAHSLTSGTPNAVRSYISSEGSPGGSFVRFATTDASSVLAERMRLTGPGYLTIPYQPNFSSIKGANFTETSGVNVVTNWNENHDVGGHFNASTGRFTAPVAGKYVFLFVAMHSGGVSGDQQHRINKNGSVYQNSNSTADGSSWQTVTVATIINLSAGDYVEPAVYSSATSGAISVYGGAFSGFHGYMLG